MAKKYASKKKTSSALQRTSSTRTQASGLFESFTQYVKKQEAAVRENKVKQFTFFIMGFAFFYLIATAALGLFPPLFFETITGQTLATLLSLQGAPIISANTSFDGYSILIQPSATTPLAEPTRIIVSWLCSGILEIIILVGAIVASFGVSWHSKAKGIVVAIVSGFVFNLLRVWITANIILTQSTGVIELAHDVLFKVLLFGYITIFYVAWFYRAMVEEDKENKKK